MGVSFASDPNGENWGVEEDAMTCLLEGNRAGEGRTEPWLTQGCWPWVLGLSRETCWVGWLLSHTWSSSPWILNFIYLLSSFLITWLQLPCPSVSVLRLSPHVILMLTLLYLPAVLSVTWDLILGVLCLPDSELSAPPWSWTDQEPLNSFFFCYFVVDLEFSSWVSQNDVQSKSKPVLSEHWQWKSLFIFQPFQFSPQPLRNFLI